MAVAAHARIEVTPTGGTLGAIISGIDLSGPLDAQRIAPLRQTWLKHQVLVFRKQHLSDEQLVALARRFGEPHHVAPTLEYDRTGLLPEIDVVSNVVEGGRQIGTTGSGELHWHTDMSVYDVPASFTFLFGREIPSSGGATRFANMYAAYETLPQALKDKVDGRRSIHDIAYTAHGTLRKGYEEVGDKTKGPGAVHPVVRTHPETGRKALFLGRQGYGYIHGYPVRESDALLDQLWQHMTKPQFVWEHAWQEGDVVMWDNRCLIHSRGSFPSSSRRMLRRVTLQGEKPQ